MERQKITHVVLIGYMENDSSFKTRFSIPCFSIEEAEERQKYYAKKNFSADDYEVLIVKHCYI